MSQARQGLLWIGGGILAVTVSQLLLAIGSLLGILVLPWGALFALYGVFLLISTTRSTERWSEPLGWSVLAIALIGAGVFTWIDIGTGRFVLFSVVVLSLVGVARRRRARLAREWREHLALQRPPAGSGSPDS